MADRCACSCSNNCMNNRIATGLAVALLSSQCAVAFLSPSVVSSFSLARHTSVARPISIIRRVSVAREAAVAGGTSTVSKDGEPVGAPGAAATAASSPDSVAPRIEEDLVAINAPYKKSPFPGAKVNETPGSTVVAIAAAPANDAQAKPGTASETAVVGDKTPIVPKAGQKSKMEAPRTAETQGIATRSTIGGGKVVEPLAASKAGATGDGAAVDGDGDGDGAAAGRGAAVTNPKRNKKDDAPEASAAEKVLSLVDLGLVDKEEAAAYYDALSNLERTTREAKEAALQASSQAPTTSSGSGSDSHPWQQDPISLAPFPFICAALGIAGMHSLHLTGYADTVASVCGGTAGAAVGGLVVVGDDPVGRFARGAGSAIGRVIGSAGGWAGKEVSAGAAGAAGAAAAAAEEALVKAPVTLAGAVANSIVESFTMAVSSVVGLPGEFFRRTVKEAQAALQSTSEAAVNLPGEVVRKAADAAADALQSTSDAAVSAVKESVTTVTESPKEAAKRLQEAVKSPEKVLETASSLLPRSSGQKASPEPPKQQKKVQPTQKPTLSLTTTEKQAMGVASAIEQEGDGADEVDVAELEAKMSSVQEALDRFDAVKNRIEKARTSGSLRETVGMTRTLNLNTERKRDEAMGATPQGKGSGAATSVDDTDATPARASRTAKKSSPTKTESPKVMDEDKRRRVAEILLEKASQRAEAAKVGLQTAAASARRNADSASSAAAAAAATAAPVGTGVPSDPTPQIVGASERQS